MSGPTRGMVAGQPIRTGALTAEYEAGWDRTFGMAGYELLPTRNAGRYRYDPQIGRCVPVVEYVELGRVPVVGDAHYDGLRAPDGADISSRTKHRAYMREHGVTTADDFTNTWAKAERDRGEFYAGKHDRGERRDQVGRTIYELEKKERR